MTTRRETLSVAQARRIALGAQGFTDPPPNGAVDIRHLRRVVRRVGLFQMDSVNVLVRSHYLPLFSRLGRYPVELLDRAAYRPPRELFEYWGHEASLLPVGLHPYLRWRMAEVEKHAWGGMRRLAQEKPEFVEWVLQQVRDRGPVTAGEIEHDAPRRMDNWGWNWSDVKTALEWLFWSGQVTAAARRNGFTRVYDLPERVLPREVLDIPTPPNDVAFRELIAIAARALGVATEPDLRDYFRLPGARSRQAVRELVEEGRLIPVQVEGWQQPAYLDPNATIPRTVRARTLISPFDSLMWERARTERLFGFRYRIEIYTPAHKRVYGYYVLPFLLDEHLVARVDLKADRKAGVLRIPAAWEEPGAKVEGGTERIARELAAHLGQLAEWLGLDTVAAPETGDLAPALTGALAMNGAMPRVL